MKTDQISEKGLDLFELGGARLQGKPGIKNNFKKVPHLLGINHVHATKGLMHNGFPEMTLPKTSLGAAQPIFDETLIPDKAHITEGDKTLNLPSRL